MSLSDRDHIMPIDEPLNQTTSFQTADGTLYVSKPFRSKSSKKMRAMITFAPRKSHFDINNESSGSNEFRASGVVCFHSSSHSGLGILLFVLDIHVPLHT